MAVIFAVVGGGAVIGILAADDDDDSDYDDYDDYDDYSDYSDAEERRRRRIEAKKKEIDDQKYEINTYKTQNVNQHLELEELIRQDGVSVSVSAVGEDGNTKIQKEENQDAGSKSAPLQAEIDEIDKVLNRIDQILSEGN